MDWALKTEFCDLTLQDKKNL